MKNFFFNLHKKSSCELNNYAYQDAQHIILTCSELKALGKHEFAINLYEKFERIIILSDFEIVGLTTMIDVCTEISDYEKKIYFAEKLKKLIPDHPKLTSLS